jgi:hypothetical protein
MTKPDGKLQETPLENQCRQVRYGKGRIGRQTAKFLPCLVIFSASNAGRYPHPPHLRRIATLVSACHAKDGCIGIGIVIATLARSTQSSTGRTWQ